MPTERDILEILANCCGQAPEPETELIESGLLDSLGLILLAEALEDRGVDVSVARIPKSALATPRALAAWLRENAG